MRGTWRPGWRAWLGGVAFVGAVVAGYLGFAGLGVLTPTVITVVAALVAGAVLVMAMLAYSGPLRGAGLKAAVALIAYFLTLIVWPPGGTTPVHVTGAVVATVLGLGLFLRYREGLRGAEAAVLVAAGAGLAVSLGMALRALAVSDARTGAGIVAAGCVAGLAYLVASAVEVDPPPVPEPRVSAENGGVVLSGGSRRSPERAPQTR